MSHRQFKVTTVPTMKVKRKADNIECVINKTDFNDELYSVTRVSPSKSAAEKKPVVSKAEK